MPNRPNDPTNPDPQPPPPAAPAVPKQRACGTMQVHHRLLRTSPAYVRARVASENYFHESRLRRIQGMAAARPGITTIPVVVHVVFNAAAENISDAQVKSQIDVLNRDYRMKNADISSVPAAFKPVVGDARIEFRLASQDPAGAATNGITRTQTAKTSFSDDDGIKSAATGGVDAWPADRYLNIWTAPRITSEQGDLLGYAQFPGGAAATDGVVILHSGFGTSGTATAPFNLGRTATHEIGHWLNLRHIWGDDGNGCNGSDFVNDTPNQADHNFGTPAFPHVTCNNGPDGDMFMNYMDYVDDIAMFMFTAGQVDRMQASLDGDRSTIGTTTTGPATTPTADVPPTLKFSDDAPPPTTLKFRDDLPPPTLKFRDDAPPPTLKFRDDVPPPTLKFRDDAPPTLKFRDDLPVPTLKFRDDAPTPTAKFFDDVKSPVLDKNPFADQPKPPGSDVQPPFGPGRATPFILSTPHHSTAWTQSFPEAAHAQLVQYEQQIQQYEELLQAYADAEAANQLGPEDRQAAESIHQEYLALVQEYRALAGG